MTIFHINERINEIHEGSKGTHGTGTVYFPHISRTLLSNTSWEKGVLSHNSPVV